MSELQIMDGDVSEGGLTYVRNNLCCWCCPKRQSEYDDDLAEGLLAEQLRHLDEPSQSSFYHVVNETESQSSINNIFDPRLSLDYIVHSAQERAERKFNSKASWGERIEHEQDIVDLKDSNNNSLQRSSPSSSHSTEIIQPVVVASEATDNNTGGVITGMFFWKKQLAMGDRIDQEESLTLDELNQQQ